jgi:alkylation response protein AidB-like acyl-CoA dehydrogenase/alpha-beta hydrolase superfamily lysophospholipase
MIASLLFDPAAAQGLSSVSLRSCSVPPPLITVTTQALALEYAVGAIHPYWSSPKSFWTHGVGHFGAPLSSWDTTDWLIIFFAIVGMLYSGVRLHLQHQRKKPRAAILEEPQNAFDFMMSRHLEGRPPEEIGRDLYDRFIAKSNILKMKAAQEDWQAAARSNDELLEMLRQNSQPNGRAIYEAIEAAYLAHVKAFVDSRIAPRAALIDRLVIPPLDLYQDMAREGLIGTQFKQVDGGVGLSSKTWLRVNALVAEVSSGVTLGALNVLGSLGPDPLEKKIDNPKANAQRHNVLVSVLHGEALITFSLTEEEAGSDNAAIRSEVKNGRLDGQKIFITMGMVLPADYRQILELPAHPREISRELRKAHPEWGDDLALWTAFREQVAVNVNLYQSMEHWQVIAARTKPKAADKPAAGIEGLLVQMKKAGNLPAAEGRNLIYEMEEGGKIIARRSEVHTQHGSGTAEFTYDQVPVDLERAQMGSLKVFLETLSRGRFTISAHAIGILRGLERILQTAIAEKSTAAAAEGSPELEAARGLLREVSAKCDLGMQLLEQGADLKDKGHSITALAALGKVMAGASATPLCGRTLHVLLTLGYHPGSELKALPEPLRDVFGYLQIRDLDAKLLEIGEGTTEIQQKILTPLLLADPLQVLADKKMEMPALLANPEGPEYASELARLREDKEDLKIADVLYRLLLLRNEALILYRQRVVLPEVLYAELPELEGRLQMLLAGYNELKNNRPLAQLDIAPVVGHLDWYIDDTLRWLNQRAFGSLPRQHADYDELMRHLYNLTRAHASWQPPNRPGSLQQALSEQEGMLRGHFSIDIPGLVPALHSLIKSDVLSAENQAAVRKVIPALIAEQVLHPVRSWPRQWDHFVTFPVSLGRLWGYWYPASQTGASVPTIIVITPGGTDAEKYLDHARMYNAMGMNALVISMRAQGSSEGDYSTLGAALWDATDLKRVIQQVRERFSLPHQPIFLHGISYGAVVALQVMERSPSDVVGVIPEGCPPALADAIANRGPSWLIKQFGKDFDKVFGSRENTQKALSAESPNVLHLVEAFLKRRFRERPHLPHSEFDVRNVYEPTLWIYGVDDTVVPTEDRQRIQRSLRSPALHEYHEFPGEHLLEGPAVNGYREILQAFIQRVIATRADKSSSSDSEISWDARYLQTIRTPRPKRRRSSRRETQRSA